jgi:hypothetical protein
VFDYTSYEEEKSSFLYAEPKITSSNHAMHKKTNVG